LPFNITLNDIRSVPHFPQRVVPDIQHPFSRDNPVAPVHRQVVEYAQGPVDQQKIRPILRDIRSRADAIDQPPPPVKILGHERAVNFPVSFTLLLPPLQDHSYERYNNSQRRNRNSQEVL